MEILFQEFELQIVQRKEEEHKPPKQETAIAICIPQGTIDEVRKEGKGCCEGIGDILRRIVCMPRRKVPHRFGNIISSA
jgi:hypothetical protein